MAVLLGLVSVVLAASLYLNVNLFVGRRRHDDELVATVNRCLDVLDGHYSTIARVTSQSVMSNSPEVRTVATALVNAREAVLTVAQLVEDVVIEDNSAAVALDPIAYVGADLDDAAAIPRSEMPPTARGAALRRHIDSRQALK